MDHRDDPRQSFGIDLGLAVAVGAFDLLAFGASLGILEDFLFLGFRGKGIERVDDGNDLLFACDLGFDPVVDVFQKHRLARFRSQDLNPGSGLLAEEHFKVEEVSNFNVDVPEFIVGKVRIVRCLSKLSQRGKCFAAGGISSVKHIGSFEQSPTPIAGDGEIEQGASEG